MSNDITQSSKVKEKKKEWIRTFGFYREYWKGNVISFYAYTKEQANKNQIFSEVIKMNILWTNFLKKRIIIEGYYKIYVNDVNLPCENEV